VTGHVYAGAPSLGVCRSTGRSSAPPRGGLRTAPCWQHLFHSALPVPGNEAGLQRPSLAAVPRQIHHAIIVRTTTSRPADSPSGSRRSTAIHFTKITSDTRTSADPLPRRSDLRLRNRRSQVRILSDALGEDVTVLGVVGHRGLEMVDGVQRDCGGVERCGHRVGQLTGLVVARALARPSATRLRTTSSRIRSLQ